MFTYGYIEAVNKEQHQDRLRRAEKNHLAQQLLANRDRSGLGQIISKLGSKSGKQAGRTGQAAPADLANQSA